MATKQPVYCKKTSSKVTRKNHNGPINVSRCSKTDVSSENSNDCTYDNNHCGLISRKNSRLVSRARATSRKHHVSKVPVPSKCTNNYLSTNECNEPCKLVSSYKTKNGKTRRASCRDSKNKMLKGGAEQVSLPVDPNATPADPVAASASAPTTAASTGPVSVASIKATLKEIKQELGANVPDIADTIDSDFVKNAINLIQSKTQSKVDPKNELRNLDINLDGRVVLNDLLLLASFKLADADFSGSLSLSEAEMGLSAILGKSANLTDKEFKTADISGNNSLDFSEYQNLYVFKSNGSEIPEDNNQISLSKPQLKTALAELGITSTTDDDINNADMNKNDKIDFAEFLLLTTFKLADMNTDVSQKADSKLDYRETAMAFRLLGMEITQDDFNQADTDNSGALDFSEFSSFVAYKKVMKDNKLMDKSLLTKALDFLNLSSLANEKRETKASERAAKAKNKAEQDEEDRIAKEKKEQEDIKRAELKEKGLLQLEEKDKESRYEALAQGLKNHLKTLKLCDGNLLKNPDNLVLPSEKQKCLEKAQVDDYVLGLNKCDGSKLVNPGTENEFPYTQVCMQGGRSMVSLNQFMKIVKSIRNNRIEQSRRLRTNRRKMYF